jgi:hypothetical protein
LNESVINGLQGSEIKKSQKKCDTVKAAKARFFSLDIDDSVDDDVGSSRVGGFRSSGASALDGDLKVYSYRIIRGVQEVTCFITVRHKRISKARCVQRRLEEV